MSKRQLDDLLEHGEAYMFHITNVNKQRSPRDMKVRDTVIAIIDNFFETNEFALLYICETCLLYTSNLLRKGKARACESLGFVVNKNNFFSSVSGKRRKNEKGAP